MDGLIRCPRCWKHVPDTSKFCRRCGSALVRAAPVPPPPLERPRGSWAPAAMVVFMVMAAFVPFGMLYTSSRPPMVSPPPPPVEGETAPPELQAPVPWPSDVPPTPIPPDLRAPRPIYPNPYRPHYPAPPSQTRERWPSEPYRYGEANDYGRQH